MIFHFYCDESFAGNAERPELFTISGFLSDDQTWAVVEQEWNIVNQAYKVDSFHAAALNGGHEQYNGWDSAKRKEYSSRLLTVIHSKGHKMRAYNCGMLGEPYRRILSSAGQLKIGHPWIACFQSCIAMIARDMNRMPHEDRLCVTVADENRFGSLAVESFDRMSRDQSFNDAYRLLRCSVDSPSSNVRLQIADLMAYEYFKRMRGAQTDSALRPALNLIQKYNAYLEGYFDEKTLINLKPAIEAADCPPNTFVVIPDLSSRYLA